VLRLVYGGLGLAAVDEILQQRLQVVAECAQFGDDDTGVERSAADVVSLHACDGEGVRSGALDVGPCPESQPSGWGD